MTKNSSVTAARNHRAVCLLSDGLDSPVAALFGARAGYELILINMITVDNSKPLDVVLQVSRKLVTISSYVELWTVNFMPIHKCILNQIASEYSCLVCKRTMLKVAEAIAIQRNADFIITGDSIGEQASQTTSNLLTLTSALTQKSVLRPVCGMNKDETIAIARNFFGRFLTSWSGINCPTVPKMPRTASDIDTMLRVEEKYDYNENIKRVLATLQQIALE